MQIERRTPAAEGIRFSAMAEGQEIGRAYLYLLRNDLHREPFGFIEDVFVAEGYRGRGVATQLLTEVLAEARRRGCYKVIDTSRFARTAVHAIYERLGFRKHGWEFRLDLAPTNPSA